MDDLERRLVADAARGDEAAFSRLYHLHRGRVYNFVYRMVGARSTAEDITHEAFMVLLQRPARYEPARGSLLTFLCAVARHHALHHFRRGNYELEESAGHQGASAEPPAQSDADPLEELLAGELTEMVDQAIASLSPPLREVIVLREFQGLSYEEIAQVTGAEVSVIKVRLHRARQSLKRRLAPYLRSHTDEYHAV